MGDELYKQIVKLCPEWHSDNGSEDAIKVGMTSSVSDNADLNSTSTPRKGEMPQTACATSTNPSSWSLSTRCGAASAGLLESKG